jgi:DNA-binding Lrp family transcriptional regulator
MIGFTVSEPRRYSRRMAVDTIDRAIVAALVADARLSIRAIAERIHISRNAAHNRVQTLVRNGVLRGFTARVDRKSLGLNVTALVIIKIGNVEWPKLATSLSELPYVESVLAVSGDIDFVLTVSAPDHERLSEVIMRQIHEMPGVLSTRSHVVLDSRDGTPPGATRDDWHGSDRVS